MRRRSDLISESVALNRLLIPIERGALARAILFIAALAGSQRIVRRRSLQVEGLRRFGQGSAGCSWGSTGSGVRSQSSRRSATCLKKGRSRFCEGVDMKFGFIARHRSAWPVAWLCEVLGVSRSGFHAWLKSGPGARSREDDGIMPAVRASFVASARTYGARGIRRDVREAGFSCVRLAQDRTSEARSGAAGAAP
jgi:hypothetical protein